MFDVHAIIALDKTRRMVESSGSRPAVPVQDITTTASMAKTMRALNNGALAPPEVRAVIAGSSRIRPHIAPAYFSALLMLWGDTVHYSTQAIAILDGTPPLMRHMFTFERGRYGAAPQSTLDGMAPFEPWIAAIVHPDDSSMVVTASNVLIVGVVDAVDRWLELRRDTKRSRRV